MSQGLFRQSSLDRLSSPEQLDSLITITSPKSWFALLALALILLTAVMWGIFGSIPTKVNSQGVIMKSYGIYNVTHPAMGQITDIRVSVGDRIKRGEVLARIEQSDLVEQINDLKKQLADVKVLEVENAGPTLAKTPDQGLYELYELTRQINNAKASLPYEEANYKNAVSGKEHETKMAQLSLEQAKIQEQNQDTYVKKLDLLYQSGGVSQNDLDNAKKELQILQLKSKAAAEDLAKLEAGEWEDTIITYKARLQQAQLTIESLGEEFTTKKAIKISETDNKIKKLQDKLEFGSDVVSPVDGIVTEVKVSKGEIIQPGVSLFGIEREGGTIIMEVLLYIPAGEGKVILPGMEARISPSTVKKEEYGYMLGSVTSVSEYPASAKGMMQTLGNEQLVTRLSGQGASLEVHVDLVIDDRYQSGYRWSSSKGPPMNINSGTFCDASIIISKQRPISMVIPMFKKAFVK